MFTLEHARPQDLGLSSARLDHARANAQRGAEELGCSGGGAIVIRRDRVVGEWYWGRRGFEADSPPFDAETMVPMASVTKGITATALALLLQDGALWLDDPVSRFIPELLAERMADNAALARITVRHLATHSSGLPRGDRDWYDLYQHVPADRDPYPAYVEGVLLRAQQALSFEPGTSHAYSDPAVCLLGEVIYRLTGQRVPQFVHERLFGPLGLERLGWDFDEALAADISASVTPGWGRAPASTKAFRRVDAPWGGLIGCGRDLATFGLMLLHEGELGGVRVMSPLAVRMMSSCQMPLPARPQYPHRGLLWWIKAEPDSPEMGHVVPYGSYCHGGATHCVLVIMPALDIVAVMIRNRAGNPPGFVYSRDYPMFMDAVAGAVDEV
jgi:CubicO group peptidase (beta-lactamase class C family)